MSRKRLGLLFKFNYSLFLIVEQKLPYLSAIQIKCMQVRKSKLNNLLDLDA